MRNLLRRIAWSVVCPFGAILSTVGTGLGIATAARSLFGSSDGGATGNANAAAQSSSHYYDTLANIGQEQWDLYRSEGLPLLRSLATKAQEDRTAQETELATGAVKDSFAAARENAKRQLNLTGGDTTDRAAAILGPSYMDEGARIAGAITDARRTEQQRQFQQTAQVAGGYQPLASSGPNSIGAAAGGNATLAGVDSRMGVLADQRASQGAYGGVMLASNASRWFNPTGARPAGTTNNTGPVDYGSGYWGGGQDTSVNVRDGGMIGRPAYADGGGVIRGPGTGTSDSVPMRAREGSYILSADTVRAIGHKKVHDLIEKAGVRPGTGGESYSGMAIRASNGEAEIPPEAVKYHGAEFFNKLQQKYHRPVMDDDGGGGLANGGVIRKRGLPKMVEDAIFRAMPSQAIGRRT